MNLWNILTAVSLLVIGGQAQAQSAVAPVTMAPVTLAPSTLPTVMAGTPATTYVYVNTPEWEPVTQIAGVDVSEFRASLLQVFAAADGRFANIQGQELDPVDDVYASLVSLPGAMNVEIRGGQTATWVADMGSSPYLADAERIFNRSLSLVQQSLGRGYYYDEVPPSHPSVVRFQRVGQLTKDGFLESYLNLGLFRSSRGFFVELTVNSISAPPLRFYALRSDESRQNHRMAEALLSLHNAHEARPRGLTFIQGFRHEGRNVAGSYVWYDSTVMLPGMNCRVWEGNPWMLSDRQGYVDCRWAGLLGSAADAGRVYQELLLNLQANAPKDFILQEVRNKPIDGYEMVLGPYAHHAMDRKNTIRVGYAPTGDGRYSVYVRFSEAAN